MRDAAIAVLLGAAALGAVALADSPAPTATVGPSAGSTGASVAPPAPSARRAPRAIELPRGDPFRPFDQPAPAPPAAAAAPGSPVRPACRFCGIIKKGALVLALIDDGLYKVGDTVAGATVREIDAQRVVLERDGVPEVLTIEEN
jgi:hypothetical protein